jgi:hypothetical protein
MPRGMTFLQIKFAFCKRRRLLFRLFHSHLSSGPNPLKSPGVLQPTLSKPAYLVDSPIAVKAGLASALYIVEARWLEAASLQVVSNCWNISSAWALTLDSWFQFMNNKWTTQSLLLLLYHYYVILSRVIHKLLDRWNSTIPTLREVLVKSCFQQGWKGQGQGNFGRFWPLKARSEGRDVKSWSGKARLASSNSGSQGPGPRASPFKKGRPFHPWYFSEMLGVTNWQLSRNGSLEIVGNELMTGIFGIL